MADKSDRTKEQKKLRSNGPGLRFEKRHNRNRRCPLVRHLPGKDGQQYVMQTAQLCLRLRRGHAVGEPSECLQIEFLPWVDWIIAAIGNRNHELRVCVWKVDALGHHADDPARYAVNADGAPDS
jgi:hypothetical protein